MRKESVGKNLFDHRVAMDSPGVSGSGNDNDRYFEFAFNARNFSDRVLRIEITLDFPELELAARGCGGGVSSLRKEEGMLKAAEFTLNDDENIRSCDTLDLQDSTSVGIHDAESVAVIAVPPSGDEVRHSDASLNLGCSTVLRVKSLFVSSAILAAKSPFFYKLFSNGMQESDQRHATLRIHESEEAALMDLLSYMYSKKLSSSTIPALLDVLMAADKFEVASCMRHCSKLLCNLPMTQESALVYLDLPSSVSMASAVQPLLDSAKKYLATCYYDITKHQAEIMCLPLAAVEAILCSDNLQVPNEDAVYDFVLKWVQSQYPKGEERWEVLGSLLTRVVRFPHMTCRKLKRALLPLNEFDHELVSKLVIEALFFKAETYHRQHALASSKSSINYRYVERAYKYRPVKVMEFESPYKQCIVYLDLKREECANLFPFGRVYSQAFHLGEQGFFLSAHCNIDQQSSSESFGLFLGMQEKGAAKLAVVYEFAARMRPTGEFASKYKGYYLFTGGKAVGYRNPFSIPWTTFMAEDSPYFINGVLHLRAELTIKQQQPTTVSAVQQ